MNIAVSRSTTRYLAWAAGKVAGAHHDHLICARCGIILEFEDDEIERLQEKIAQRLGGFTVVRHRHELYALCPKARGVDDRCPGGGA